MRSPLADAAAIVEARHSLDLGTSVLEQLLVVELLREGDALLDERRASTRERRDAMAAALHRHVPEWSFDLPPGGLNLWCELPVDRGEELVRAGEEAGVRLARGSQFGIQGGLGRFVRVPFCVASDEADEVGRRLARAWQQALSREAPVPSRTPLIA